jgi:methionyl-tRNA formyltransferase
MRLSFAGTPEFAAVALDALHAAGHEIALVLTQPDRPAGRGLQLQPSAVKQRALALGLPLAQPRGLRLEGRWPQDARSAQLALQEVGAELMVVAAYGLILPRWVLELPPRGCLNIHASLLPRWRGAAPIHRAIEAGDTRTGVTLMQMDEGLDTGDMLLHAEEAILPDDNTARLHDRLAALGARLVVQALAQPGALAREPQPAQGVTYARKVEKAEAAVDWREPAVVIERRVRAFDPFPGAHFGCSGEQVKLWRAQVRDGGPDAAAKAPGTVLELGAQGLLVACGTGALACLEVQRAGGRRQAAAEWLRSPAAGLRPGVVLPPSLPQGEASARAPKIKQGPLPTDNPMV